MADPSPFEWGTSTFISLGALGVSSLVAIAVAKIWLDSQRALQAAEQALEITRGIERSNRRPHLVIIERSNPCLANIGSGTAIQILIGISDPQAPSKWSNAFTLEPLMPGMMVDLSELTPKAGEFGFGVNFQDVERTKFSLRKDGSAQITDPLYIEEIETLRTKAPQKYLTPLPVG